MPNPIEGMEAPVFNLNRRGSVAMHRDWPKLESLTCLQGRKARPTVQVARQEFMVRAELLYG